TQDDSAINNVGVVTFSLALLVYAIIKEHGAPYRQNQAKYWRAVIKSFGIIQRKLVL
ncbi:hypothetical protein J6590_052389, partial [Homalodisca vitripennis]